MDRKNPQAGKSGIQKRVDPENVLPEDIKRPRKPPGHHKGQTVPEAKTRKTRAGSVHQVVDDSEGAVGHTASSTLESGGEDPNFTAADIAANSTEYNPRNTCLLN